MYFKMVLGALGWLSQLSIWLWPRSWFQSLRVQRLHWAYWCNHRACFGFSFSAFPLLMLFLSKINKIKNKNKNGLWIKSHNIVSPPYGWVLLEDFNSQSCLHWASSNLSITVQVFLPWNGFSHWLSLLCLYLVSHGSLYLPSTILEQWFALCPTFSYVSKKSCWLFKQFSFLLIRMEW